MWVRPALNDEFAIPLGGQVAAIEPKRIKIKTDNAGDLYVSKEQIVKLMHSSCVKDVNDMITLGDLTEYSILRNLEMRYYKKNIYVIIVIKFQFSMCINANYFRHTLVLC